MLAAQRCNVFWLSRVRVVLAIALVLGIACAAPAQSGPPVVVKLSIHDTIQPITAAYLKRGLDEAAAQHAAAVVVSLGTPGGLLSSTREMVAEIEGSPVPVIVFIEPAGSRAGSAGFFILEAADVAAMAPGTNAGAAHPILEGQTMDPVLKQKVENDAAAFLRSYVTVRGRDAASAEDAVRNSKSYSEAEALKLKLVDVVATNDTDLLRQLDGKTIKRFNGSTQTLRLTNARVETLLPSLRERLLTRLTSPDLDVLLLMAGALLIYLEFNVPGTIVPGALGTVMVLLAIFGLNLLPVQHTSVLLLFAALALMVLEAKFASHGVLATAGVVCLVFGLATLVNGPVPELRVHYGVAAGAGVGFGVITFALAWIAVKAHKAKRLTGPDAMVGQLAVAMTPLAPTGQVEVRGEIWSARLAGGTEAVPAGAEVKVQAVDGLVLMVRP